jgi:hypothetical protein
MLQIVAQCAKRKEPLGCMLTGDVNDQDDFLFFPNRSTNCAPLETTAGGGPTHASLFQERFN